MNVFDAIYLNENDPIERSFIAAETALDIAITRANKEYVYESGLIELSDNKLFIEAGTETSDTNVKRENSFVKAVKAICTAIRNFIGDLIASIINIFDGRENLSAEEYFDAPTTKIRLDNDVREMEAIVDDEIRKGNKLLQKISSATGISDEEIDSWMKKGAERIGKLAPVLIPIGLTWGFKKMFKSSLKDKEKAVNEAEKAATSGDKSDPKKNQQKNKVLGWMSTMIKDLGKSCTNVTKEWRKAKKKIK